MTAPGTMPTTDAELLTVFEQATLPFEQWTHATHVRVAYLYLREHPFADALDRVRRFIQAYNHAHGVPSTRTQGYHETITVAFMTLVAEALRESGDPGNSGTFLEQHPDLLSARVLERYYSRELLFSPAAKQTFLGPDLHPLPD